MNPSDLSLPRLDRADIDRLATKLSRFAEELDPPEQRALAGLIELAGKMYEGTGAVAESTAPTAVTSPAILPLKREILRELNVWKRLLETQGHSLWTCDRPVRPGEEVINPLKR